MDPKIPLTTGRTTEVLTLILYEDAYFLHELGDRAALSERELL